MRGKVEPLLCELHAHTTWSDGELSLPQLVDLYGRSGFDVLGVTDHCIRTDDPGSRRCGATHVHVGNYSDYLSEIEAEASAGPGRIRPPARAGPRADLQRPRPQPRRARSRARLPRLRQRRSGSRRCAGARARRGGGAHCRPSVSHPARELARSRDAALRSRLAHPRPARRSLGALQPVRPLRLGRSSAVCRPSRAAISTGRSTSMAGRPCCRARRTRRRSSAISARRRPAFLTRIDAAGRAAQRCVASRAAVNDR